MEDITSRVEAEERLRYLSYHDILTGLYNRTFMEEELEQRPMIRRFLLSSVMSTALSWLMMLSAMNRETGCLSRSPKY